MRKFEALMAEQREGTYKFLASICLKPPSDSLIAMIKDRSILSVFQDNDDSGEAVSYPHGLFEFVRQAEEIPNLKDEMEAEHTALFVLPSGVLPHEAVYLDNEKRLGGKVTISVKQFYERAGMDIHDSCIEMPDHLGMELEFMGFLCNIEKELWGKNELISLQKCIQFQKVFLEEHLSKWIYQCCEKVIEKSTYGFYKAIAHFIIEFMRSEEEYVPELYENACKEGEVCGTTS